MENRTAIRLMLQPLGKYSDFHGRARKAELWLYLFLVAVVLNVGLLLAPYTWVPPEITSSVSTLKDAYALTLFGGGAYSTIHFLAFTAVGLALFIPMPALFARRLHDRNASGWWSLPMMLPYVVANFFLLTLFLDFHFQPIDIGTDLFVAGLLGLFAGLTALLVAASLKGTDGPNRFGPDPLRDGRAGSGAAAKPGRASIPSRGPGVARLTRKMAYRLMFQPFGKYFDFIGRARRAEFWLFVLFLAAVSVFLTAIHPNTWLTWSLFAAIRADNLDFGRVQEISEALASPGVFAIIVSVAYAIFYLATFLPAIAVTVRRLHDRNISGLWLLVPLLPVVVAPVVGGTLFLVGYLGLPPVIAKTAISIAGSSVVVMFLAPLVFLAIFCLKGTKGPNRFGDDPLPGRGA